MILDCALGNGGSTGGGWRSGRSERVGLREVKLGRDLCLKEVNLRKIFKQKKRDGKCLQDL